MNGAHAIVVGLGAVGSPAALYLAAAGVGRIGVVDPAVVEPGDPSRAVLHFAPDIGLPKAENAAVKLRALNRDVHVERYPAEVTPENGFAIVAGADLVLDCTGGLVVNDACCEAGVPLVWASLAEGGRVMSVEPGTTACVRCAWPAVPAAAERPSAAPTAAERSPAALAGVVGSMQALEALRILGGGSARGELAGVGGTRVPVARRDECPSCAVPAAAQSA